MVVDARLLFLERVWAERGEGARMRWVGEDGYEGREEWIRPVCRGEAGLPRSRLFANLCRMGRDAMRK